MTRLFDGVTGLLADVFGSAVTFVPLSGVARSVQSVFRESPVEVLSGDGMPIIVSQPTWRVRADLAPDAVAGAVITLADGRTFRLLNYWTSGNPADDRTRTWALELVP